MSETSCKVVNAQGKEVGTVDLNPEVFGARILHEVVHGTVRWQRAKSRAGTHSVLTRSNMKGGKKKPFKQKGTGRARAGTTVSPLMVGGAVVHGPTPRSYEFRMNKVLRKRALSSVLTDKAQSGEIKVVDAFDIGSGKTKDAAKLLAGIGVNEGGVTVVLSAAWKTNEVEVKVERALRNLPSVTVLPVGAVNVFDLLKNKFMLCSKESLKAIEDRVVSTAK